MIKISYDENFKVTGIGHQNAYETTEPFILLNLTDEEFNQLLDMPFKTLMVDVESNSVISVEILEEPVEVITTEDLKRENDELRAKLSKLEALVQQLLEKTT